VKKNWLLFSGLLAPVVYLGTVIVGAALRPAYSHLSEPISELTAAGAPNKAVLDLLFVLYNVLVALFALGLLQKANQRLAGRWSGRLASLSLIGVGVCGALLQFFFPQDPGGAQAAVTATGSLHIAVAGVAALLSMLSVLCSALWFRAQPAMKGYVVYSLVTLAVMFVSGGAGAAAATAGGFSLFGLVERITIGAFIQWLFFVALKWSAEASADTSSVAAHGTYRRVARH
jgi:hypothetical protein